MIVIRPVTEADLDQLEHLATVAGFGLTTLPKDRALLGKRICHSVESFTKQSEKPAGELYLFVMEDLANGRLVGTSGIVSKVGGFEPFYAYRIETSVHESKMLQVRKEIQSLHLVQEHSGPCEIGSLFLDPQYRRSSNGRVLSLARFLFMAQHSGHFEPQVIAEMRGVVDRQGRSPFWEALGRHFFEVEYPTADYLSMLNKKFIADLMPKHPIYIPVLPATAQDVIGKTHRNTEPAKHLLEAEGFVFSGMVDIFEAGPVLVCARDKIRSVKESRTATVQRLSDDKPDSQTYIIGNTQLDFRACQGPLSINDDGTVELNKLTAMALRVKVGQRIRYVAMRPDTTTRGTTK